MRPAGALSVAAETLQISACIITLNEAQRIERCLEALSFCDEIIVVDAHSTDDTRTIAARCGARVIERDWPGYRSQKQFAADAARHEWVLSVDADEWVTPALAAEILELKGRGFAGVAGYSVARLTRYFGGSLRHGNAWPDRKIRLYRKSAARWTGYEVHEKIALEGPVGRLRAPLEHDAYHSLDDQLTRMDRYARLMAEELAREGRRCTLAAAFLHPAWRFLRGMLIKGGLLDGWRGWLFHCVEAGYVHRKYLRLWAAARLKRAAS
jgi:glycosyltransferase involved in cell wall biosynthesis